MKPSSTAANGGKPRITVVTGPTAAGKSALALALAAELGAEIVSADSMQVYRGLDIGTAKPTLQERAVLPHHLIDIAGIEESYTAARYVADAGAAIADIAGRGKPVVVVGGTPLYIKVLLSGLAPGPGRDDKARASLEEEWDSGGRETLWAELLSGDPELAARLHPNDRTRIIRGLEVWRVSGRPLSAFQKDHGFSDSPYEALLLGVNLPREELYDRIDRRVEEMLSGGWLREVAEILEKGHSPSLVSLKAIGYIQLVDHLTMGVPYGQTVEKIKQATRNYAKRQLTWMRRMGLYWLAPGDLEAARSKVANFLG